MASRPYVGDSKGRASYIPPDFTDTGWRIYITATAGGLPEVAELSFQTAIAVPITADGTPVADSEVAGFEAANAFDNVITAGNNWRSADGVPAFIGMEWGSLNPKSVGIIELTNADSAASYPTAFNIQKQDEAGDWVTTGTVSGLTWEGDLQTRSWNIDGTEIFGDILKTKWRILITSLDGATDFAELAEFSFYDVTEALIPADGTAIADTETAGFEATKAFDTIISAGNYWRNTADVPAFIGMDWGEANAKDVEFINITNADSLTRSPMDFQIQYLSATNTWITTGTVLGVAWSGTLETIRYAIDGTEVPIITTISAQYWRVYISANNGAANCAVAELYFYDGGGLVDTFTNRETNSIASSFANSGNRAALAYDQLDSSKWTSLSAAPAWIGYDFGTPVALSDLQMMGQYVTGNQAAVAPKDFDIEWSNDNVSWTSIASYTGETGWTGAEVRNFVIQTPVAPPIITAQYWRMYVTLNNQDPGYTALAVPEIDFTDIDEVRIPLVASNALASAVAGANAAQNAFDQVATTEWSTTTALPQWNRMDFLAGVTPYAVNIQGVNTSFPGQSINAVKDFEIQYSDDGTSYTTLASFAGETGWTGGEVRNFVIQIDPNAPTDQYFANVSLLVIGNEVAGTTTFPDASTNALTVISQGGVVATASNPVNGLNSIDMPLAADYLEVATNAAFGFGTGDFTLEMQVRRLTSAAGDIPLFDFRTSGATNGIFYITNSGTTKLAFYNGTVYGNTGADIAIDTWYDVCFMRASGVLYAFIDGGLQWTGAIGSTDFGTTKGLKIGRNFNNSSQLLGQVSNVRITKGVARYNTAGYSPDIIPYPTSA